MALSLPQQWCAVHEGYVDEGHSREVGPEGSGVRVCDACLDTEVVSVQAGMDGLLDLVQNSALTVEDRAAAYAVLHQVQLRINRVLRPVKVEVIQHLIRLGEDRLGPLRVKWVAFDVEWPCNLPGNWQDSGVQDAMADLSQDEGTRDYVRHIPAHLEIDTGALGAGMANGDPHAVRLHRELRRRGWRTEGGRRATLEVSPARQ